MEPSSDNERRAYKKAAPLDTGEDEPIKESIKPYRAGKILSELGRALRGQPYDIPEIEWTCEQLGVTSPEPHIALSDEYLADNSLRREDVEEAEWQDFVLLRAYQAGVENGWRLHAKEHGEARKLKDDAEELLDKHSERKKINNVRVEDADFSWLTTIMAILTSERDLWMSADLYGHATLLHNAQHGGVLSEEDGARARRLLDAFKPHAKTNSELEA